MLEKKTDWNKKASNKIKAEMLNNNVDYNKLTESLNKIGVEKSMVNVRKTIWSGRFPYTFALQCQEAIRLLSKEH